MAAVAGRCMQLHAAILFGPSSIGSYHVPEALREPLSSAGSGGDRYLALTAAARQGRAFTGWHGAADKR